MRYCNKTTIIILENILIVFLFIQYYVLSNNNNTKHQHFIMHEKMRMKHSTFLHSDVNFKLDQRMIISL